MGLEESQPPSFEMEYECYRAAHEHAAEGRRGRPPRAAALTGRRQLYATLLGEIHGRFRRPPLQPQDFREHMGSLPPAEA